jgi:hypothetical protein
MKAHHLYFFIPSRQWCLSLFVLLFFFSCSLLAQVTDTTVVEADSAGIITPANQDSIIQAKGHAPSQSGELKKGEVRFQASDSMVFDFSGKDRIAYLYGTSKGGAKKSSATKGGAVKSGMAIKGAPGKGGTTEGGPENGGLAKVEHQEGKLSAGKITLNLDKHLLKASTDTPEDTLSEPVLTRKGQPPVRSKSIAFNYQTKKGRFKLSHVKIKQGQVIGNVVKNTSEHVVYLKDAKYSTCTLPHPHYYIKAQRMKIVKKNGKQQIFFQHAMLYLLDIPYPFVFPFGYVPGKIAHRQSGLLTPTYVSQQKATRGLGVRNLGWFQYFNDYITGQISGDIYTSGTYYLKAKTSYSKRNDYNGSIQVGYSHEQGLEPTDPDYNQTVAKNIQISHSQKFSPFSHISANIHLRTQNYYKRNSYDINDRAQTNTSSHINYSYRQPNDLFNFNASMQQNIDFKTNVTSIRGPSFNFDLHQIKPFGSSENSGIGSSKWYQNISINYQNSFESRYNFDPVRGDSASITWFQALLHPSKYRKATGNNKLYQFGFQQQASISAGNLLGTQHLNMSASIDYHGYAFPSTIRKSFNPDSTEANNIETNKVLGFIYANDFSTSLNFSTTIYGIAHAHIGHIIAFRHTMRPSISLSYSPDFSSPFFGYYRRFRTDTLGNVRKYSIFEDEVFSGPSRGGAQSVNFSLDNVFEAKKVSRDSTGEKHTKTLRLIDDLNLGTSYNFAADSLNLSDLSASLSSRVVSGLNIRASANFNFYKRGANGQFINKLLLFHGGKLMEMTNFSLSANTSFHGGKGGGVQLNKEPYFPAHYNPYNQAVFGEMDPYFNTRPIQRFKSPWSVSVNFRYSWRLNPNGRNQKSATINASNIRFNLTPKWNFSTSLGFDFIRHKFTPSNFSLSRKLHEWNLSFQFSPFGEFQYYFFSLSINSSTLESIFQKLPLLKNLSRSSSPTGAGMGGRYQGGGMQGGQGGFY